MTYWDDQCTTIGERKRSLIDSGNNDYYILVVISFVGTRLLYIKSLSTR